MGGIMDLAFCAGSAAIAFWDWRRYRRGTEARPWWRVWAAMSLLFLAFALFAPGGVWLGR